MSNSACQPWLITVTQMAGWKANHEDLEDRKDSGEPL